jgi:hypothetical protein
MSVELRVLALARAIAADIKALGAGKQPSDATLAALAALTTGPDQLIYSTGVDTFALGALTPYGRSLIDDKTALEARATMETVKQTNTMDTSAGALMLVGAFGLGAPALPTAFANGSVITDLNNPPPGTCFFMGANLLNAPSVNWFIVVQYQHNTSWITQEAYGFSGIDMRRFWRQKSNGIWQPWQEVYTGLPDVGWTGVTFQNGWANYGDATFGTVQFRRVRGMVELKGMCTGGQAGTVIFNLPAGFRPRQANIIPAVSADVFASVIIYSDGNLIWRAGGSNAWIGLAGIRFMAEV